MDDGRQPNRTLIALFRRTAEAMVDDLVRRITAAGYPGVSGAHHPVFEHIDPEGTRLTVLAARAELTHQSMGELVQTLERRGYIERRRDPTDARVRLVRLTPKGRRMVARALHEIGQIEREWAERCRLAGLDGDVASALESALRQQEATEASARKSFSA